MFFGIGIGLINIRKEIKNQIYCRILYEYFKSNIQVDYLMIERYTDTANTIGDEKNSTVSN